MSRSVSVVQDPENQIPIEIMEQSIVDISRAMKQIESSRISRKMIVTLIHAHSKVNKRDIEYVLNNLAGLEKIWLKPKVKQ